jgi:penicillin-binding protein 1C
MFDVPYATVVTARDGELLGARIASDGQWRFPSCDTVPYKFRRCIIAFEDRHFYRHFGVYPPAIVRALKQNIQAGHTVSGGSTLTMQTVRLARGEKRTVWEKFIECILATRIECHYSKSDILALYASHAPFGGNVVGLDAAAWRYFGHSADNLSWAEAATLAVLPNSPSMIHFSKNRPLLLEKRNRLLKYLHDNNEIGTTDYDLAISENLPAEPLPLPQIAPHLVEYFYKTAGGKQTVSTIDKSLQLHVESILERWHNVFIRSDIRNIAAIVIDVRSSDVAAYCGNVRFADGNSSNQVDIIRSPRSTGSILKPFLYYISLHEGEILPKTLLADIPLNINGFSPQNFNMQYDGAVPADEVVARSLNIPSVYLLRDYGVPKFYDFLQKIGISTLNKSASHYGLSLILGGAEATLWDVSFAYTAMSQALNGGSSGDQNPFSPGAVWQVFDAIKEVNRPEEIDWRYISSMQTVAWKTGTSYGFRDAWAIGATTRYVVGVWVGNANGEGKAELIGARTAGPVMFDIFNILPSAPWFKRPEGEFVEALVCRQSGHLKGRFCDDFDTVPILPAGLNTDVCPYHTSVNMTIDGRYRVYENCIEAGQPIIKQNRFVLPPVREWYYKQHHPEYKTLPPFMPGCGGDSRLPMSFIYPQSNATVYLPKQLDGSEGELTFELAHSDPDATVYWHLDSDYLGLTRAFHKYTFRPLRGKHSVTVVDDKGNTLSIGITVE